MVELAKIVDAEARAAQEGGGVPGGIETSGQAALPAPGLSWRCRSVSGRHLHLRLAFGRVLG